MASSEEVLPSGLLDFLVFPVEENVIAESDAQESKSLLVLLGEETGPELKGFLSKVLGAVGFNLEEDALLVTLPPGQKVNFAASAKNAHFHSALFFGVDPAQAQLNFNASNYHPFKVGDVSFLFAEQLSAIQSNPQLKRLLWEGLKSMFDKQS